MRMNQQEKERTHARERGERYRKWQLSYNANETAREGKSALYQGEWNEAGNLLDQENYQPRERGMSNKRTRRWKKERSTLGETTNRQQRKIEQMDQG